MPPYGSVNPLQKMSQLLAATTEQPAQPPALPSPTAWNVTVNPETRADGDKELSAAYRAALHQIKGDTAHDDAIKVYPVPSYSTFGQWWSQLGWAFQSPPVKQWIEKVGVAPESIVLIPGSGQIQYRLKPELDPDRRLHTLTQADSDWAAISGPLMETARILVADDPTAKFKPPLSPHSREAPLGVVRRFYQEPPARTHAEALVRSAALLQDKAFGELPINSHMKLHESRSEIMLDRHQTVLADIDTRYQASNELKHLSVAVRADNGGAINIAQQLLTQKIFVPLDSSYQPSGADENNGVSLKQYLDDHGLDLPANHEQLDNLANALTTAPRPSPLNGNYSGAMGWPQPIDPAIYQELRTVITQGKVGDIDLSTFKNVLAYLLDKQSISTAEARNPLRLIDKLVSSPKGQALGSALQALFEAKSIKGSANDWLLAAMQLGKTEALANADPRADVEGFALMSAENAGKTAARVVEELRVSLVTGGHANIRTSGPYATLMLASRAPEFLVKEIPDKIVLGSHAWVSFVTAVERIEAKAPGATAQMSYEQVMRQASIAPVTPQERQIEYQAQGNALRQWAVANGMGLPSTEDEMNAVRKAFDAQITVLKDAALTSLGAIPNAREMALEQLKTALPDVDPKLFEKKCIKLQPSNRHFPGPYSVLDLHMDGRPALSAPPGPNDNLGDLGRTLLGAATFGIATLPKSPQSNGAWVSSASDVDINQVLNALKTLPRLSEAYDTEFSNFAADVEKITRAQIKHLISTLPLEDRQNLEYGKITVTKEMDLSPQNTGQPRRSRAVEGAILVKSERNGQVHTYQIDRLKGEITKRRDLGDFPTGERTLEGRHPYKAFEIITPPGTYAPGLNDARSTVGIPNSFSSERTAYIAEAIVKDLDLPAVKQSGKGVTTFDSEVPAHKVAAEIGLNLIPLRSAIVNFQKGNLGEGLSDLALDIFGFVVGLGTAAKAGKAVMVGANAVGKVAQVAKIVGRAAIGSLNPASGLDDLARGLWTGARKTVSAAHKGINHLRGAARSVDLIDVIKRPDIAQGTFKTAQSANDGKALAKFDEATNKWYAYDPHKKQAYGKPLEGFAAEQSKLVSGKAENSLLDAGLSQDNVVRMGGPMENLTFIGSEMHTFEDTYKNTKRLNISAHGAMPEPRNKHLFYGTQVVVEGVAYDAAGLVALLKSKGVNPTHYDNVRLLVCYGADGISTSFAHEFQKLIDRPVKAFEGPVTMNYGATPLAIHRNEVEKVFGQQFPSLTQQELTLKTDLHIRERVKNNAPHEVDKAHGKQIIIDTTSLNGPPSTEVHTINYLPRHFS
ncbi:hypothetical protein [Pseudomonas sp. 18175]|uniref:hypothetical protein n=1 Tax=Pseudomonas sp. 18175 TaxID=3390056 RepID=UPI003D2037C4